MGHSVLMLKRIFKLFSAVCALLVLSAGDLHAREYESYYQDIWCTEQNGQAEVTLEDSSRADCITNEYAVEVDFAHKWAESIGQSLLYSELTGKLPAVLLIVNENSAKYITRFHNAADGLGIKIYTIEE